MTDALRYLFSLEHLGIKFGLENMRAIVAALDHPERAFQSIHVAGTNGKGSVTAMVDAGLRAAGVRAARYTSPHLVSIHERFVIDGRPVGDEELSAAVEHVRGRVEGLRAAGTLEVQPTFFEVTTAVGFELFRRAAVRVAVIETGLGGRLDATNVIAPALTAITSIGLDHEQFLGGTISEIAREKAGIIKPGIPVIVGRLEPDAAAEIERAARGKGAPVVRAWDGVIVDADPGGAGISLRTPMREYGRVVPALKGEHQVDNAVVAVRLLEALDRLGTAVPREAVIEALTTVVWPGRIDLRRLPDGRELLLDAAHNPSGAAALARYLERMGGRPLPLVFAAMRDKDAAGIFRALLPVVGSVVLTRASTTRSADPVALARQVRAVRPDLPLAIASSPADALAEAWRAAPRIVVAGSIYLLGDVMQAIGGA